MVSYFPLHRLAQLKMCNSTGSVHHADKGLLSKTKSHKCIFKLLQCSSKQLCLFCFLFYYFAVGQCTQLNVSTTTPTPALEKHILGVQCFGDTCFMKISSTEEALKKMLAVNEELFEGYSELDDSERKMDEEGLEKFMTDIGHKPIQTDPHAGHDHGPNEDHDLHEGHDSHEGHDHGDVIGDWSKIDNLYDLFFGDDTNSNETDSNGKSTRKRRSEEELPCITSVKELVRTYFAPKASEEIHLTLGDFMTLMPQLLFDIKRPRCRIIKESEDHEEADEDSKPPIEHSAVNIWLISFGTVTLISLVSLLGVLMIPILKHSSVLNQVIAFLIALAVGTLTGDALLHLLPHSSGLHDHSKGHEGHDHSIKNDDDHFNMMWKGLVACAGIYVFFLIEAIMGMIHRRKSHGGKHDHGEKSENDDSPSTSSPSVQHLKTNKDDITVQYSPTQSPLLSINGTVLHGKSPTSCDEKPIHLSSSQAPLLMVNGGPHKDNHVEGHTCAIVMDEKPIETGHHHHHAHKVPTTIASLAWMIIVGDGLHNITDGLAIGAAFTSSIGAGFGTSLAIFFHEIPQELGDFAILLNAGMSVKQALLCNFLSATLCFIGLIIGLILGEYTSGIILWILAFTAGGFLYIALVDLLPAMMKQLEHKECLRRFVIQNIGLLCGVGLMIVIALREDAFTSYF